MHNLKRILKIYDPLNKKIRTYKTINQLIKFDNELSSADILIGSPEFENIKICLDIDKSIMFVTNKHNNEVNEYYLDKEIPLVRVHTYFLYCKLFENENDIKLCVDTTHFDTFLEDKILNTTKSTKRSLGFRDSKGKDILIDLSTLSSNTPHYLKGANRSDRLNRLDSKVSTIKTDDGSENLQKGSLSRTNNDSSDEDFNTLTESTGSVSTANKKVNNSFKTKIGTGKAEKNNKNNNNNNKKLKLESQSLGYDKEMGIGVTFGSEDELSVIDNSLKNSTIEDSETQVSQFPDSLKNDEDSSSINENSSSINENSSSINEDSNTINESVCSVNETVNGTVNDRSSINGDLKTDENISIVSNSINNIEENEKLNKIDIPLENEEIKEKINPERVKQEFKELENDKIDVDLIKKDEPKDKIGIEKSEVIKEDLNSKEEDLKKDELKPFLNIKETDNVNLKPEDDGNKSENKNISKNIKSKKSNVKTVKNVSSKKTKSGLNIDEESVIVDTNEKLEPILNTEEQYSTKKVSNKPETVSPNKKKVNDIEESDKIISSNEDDTLRTKDVIREEDTTKEIIKVDVDEDDGNSDKMVLDDKNIKDIVVVDDKTKAKEKIPIIENEIILEGGNTTKETELESIEDKNINEIEEEKEKLALEEEKYISKNNLSLPGKKENEQEQEQKKYEQEKEELEIIPAEEKKSVKKTKAALAKEVEDEIISIEENKPIKKTEDPLLKEKNIKEEEEIVPIEKKKSVKKAKVFQPKALKEVVGEEEIISTGEKKSVKKIEVPLLKSKRIKKEEIIPTEEKKTIKKTKASQPKAPKEVVEKEEEEIIPTEEKKKIKKTEALSLKGKRIKQEEIIPVEEKKIVKKTETPLLKSKRIKKEEIIPKEEKNTKEPLLKSKRFKQEEKIEEEENIIPTEEKLTIKKTKSAQPKEEKIEEEEEIIIPTVEKKPVKKTKSAQPKEEKIEDEEEEITPTKGKKPTKKTKAAILNEEVENSKRLKVSGKKVLLESNLIDQSLEKEDEVEEKEDVKDNKQVKKKNTKNTKNTKDTKKHDTANETLPVKKLSPQQRSAITRRKNKEAALLLKEKETKIKSQKKTKK